MCLLSIHISTIFHQCIVLQVPDGIVMRFYPYILFDMFETGQYCSCPFILSMSFDHFVYTVYCTDVQSI